MKKFLSSQPVSFIILFCYVLAAFGANAYLLHDGRYVFFAANIVVTLLAVPGLTDVVKNLTGGGDSDNKDK